MQFVGTPPPDRRIIRLIGSGGMGVVYEAVDERLKRRVALKVLHPHLTIQPDMRDRLLEEARLAARVEHENVVRIYNVHEVDTGLCLEMQYVDGVSLSQLIAGRLLAPPHAVDLLLQVLEALAACHAKNVVHADLKPGNLLVTHDGKVLLGDFGIARAVFSETSSPITTLSLSGPLWGTPQYCPPEAWQGEYPNPMWDLYALGILLHEAVCGSLPYVAETPAMLMREKLEGTRIPLREKDTLLPGDIASLIDDLTASAVEDRPPSAEDALRRLRQAPDYQKYTATTKPLRHKEMPAGMSMPLPMTRMTGPYAAPPKTWKRSLVGMLVLVVLGAVIFVAGRGMRTGNEAVIDPVTTVPVIGEKGEIRWLTTVRGAAFFSYDDGSLGRELWLADNVGRVGLAADINRGSEPSNPDSLIAAPFGTTLVSATSAQEGNEPRRCSTSPPSVEILKDLVPGPLHSDPYPIASYKALVYFYLKTLNNHDTLWVTDGDQRRTGPLPDIYPEAAFLDNRNMRHFVDEEGICAVQKREGVDYLMRFWFEDGRVENLGIVDSSLRELAVIGDEYLFAMSDPETGCEMWHMNRETNRAELLRDIWKGNETSDPKDFYVWKDELYFRAENPEFGVELWKTDGTPEGTVLVHDIHRVYHDGDPSNFTGSEDWLFFRAYDSQYGLELYASNGDPKSEPRLFEIWPGSESSTPYSLAVIDDFLLFSADDGEHGEEFWKLDLKDPNAKPEMVEDIREGLESSEPHNLRAFQENGGIFVYKTGHGDGLMHVVIEDRNVRLEPYPALPLEQ